MAISSCTSKYSVAEDITFARPDMDQSIFVSADSITRWQAGSYEVLHLNGSVTIGQQQMQAVANEAILWVEVPSGTESDVHKVIAYLEGQVTIDLPRIGAAHEHTGAATDRIVDEQWLGRFFTRQTVDLNRDAEPLGTNPAPDIFRRAQASLANGATPSVQAVSFARPQGQMVVSPHTGAIQFVEPANQNPPPGSSFYRAQPNQVWQPDNPSIGVPSSVVPENYSVPPGGVISPPNSGSPFSVQITGRDASSDLNIKSFSNPQNPNERVSIGVGGFRIAINSSAFESLETFRTDTDQQVNILADNLVQWNVTRADGCQCRQFYVEGNIVFSKDRRVIYAQKMFYDVDMQRGTILDAEVLTPVPQYQGLVRLKADVVQQVDANNLQAYGTAFTTSRLGVPRYWLQSENLSLDRRPTGATDPWTYEPVMDPLTGQQAVEDEYFVESQRNRVYVAGLPVFAWPRFRASLNEPNVYLERLAFNNDQIFGFQANSGWDMYQILGFLKKPPQTRWIGVLDYLSERGLGVGSEFYYRRNELFGLPGVAQGEYRSWFINDQGLDTLGRDRIDLVPEKTNRGSILGWHRHKFAPGFQLKAELGYISDRNFLEQYYEREWDTERDALTGAQLERNVGTQSYSLEANFQINDFFTQTSWLPRFDQFVLGQSVFNNRAVWHGHSHAGYARMRAADPPTNAAELAKWSPLAWEADVEGFRVGTRQEIDFPMQVGPVKVVPYLLGDVTYWQQDLTESDLTRAYGQTGIRASLPIWRTDPTIQSTLWNVNGLAHKVTFDLEAFYADASKDLSALPLYDQLDDDSQEHFRRRIANDTFGIPPLGFVPLPFDERYFALRSGMQSNVTAPSLEIADDLAVVQMGVRQRWQTKRGMPGCERIIDWITLDSQVTWFPDADRDNFGTDFGMLDYDFNWYIGDRFSLVSDGYFDFFSQGLRTASLGANFGRPSVSNAYLGYRMIEGPISSNIISGLLTYQMSEKWGLRAGGQVDFGPTGSIGETLSLVYVGESFLWQFGVNHDVSRDNFGFRFAFEPRFTNRPQIFRPGGVAIPPAGSQFLE